MLEDVIQQEPDGHTLLMSDSENAKKDIHFNRLPLTYKPSLTLLLPILECRFLLTYPHLTAVCMRIKTPLVLSVSLEKKFLNSLITQTDMELQTKLNLLVLILPSRLLTA